LNFTDVNATFDQPVTLAADQIIIGNMCGSCSPNLIYLALIYIPLNKTIEVSTTECGGCPYISYLIPAIQTRRRNLLANVSNYKFRAGCRTNAPCYGQPTITTYSPLTSPVSSASPPSNNNLSAGAIAGIVVGSVVAALCCAGGVFFLAARRRKRKDKKKTKTPSPSSGAYYHDDLYALKL
jgi:hypothetical protein